MKDRVILSAISAVMLAIAILPLPYGYYMLVRLVVTVTAFYICYQEYNEQNKINPYVIVFGLIGLLFNPIAKIHLDKELWQVIDALSALIFGFYTYKQNKLSNNER